MAASAEPLLRASNLTCGYRDRIVLTDLDLSLEAGDSVALVGPNGSGKSTLLKTLCKSLRPLRGSVRLGGRDLGEISHLEAARLVAYVPQEEYPAFDYTARELVLMGRFAHSQGLWETAADRRAADAAMTAADCAELADRAFVELSGGERQRVLIARALAQEARLLLLDEPTSHLDARHQFAIAALLERLAAEGYAVLAAIHDLNLAASFARRMVVLSSGRLALDAPPQEAFASPVLGAAFGVTFEIVPTSAGPRVSAVGAP
jgi:iron complex transport system ATP-binding protein